MSNKEQLRAKLAAIKELKSEYFIGSSNAFYYLKVLNHLEEMWREILSVLPELQEVLTIKRLAWLLNSLRWLLQAKLNVLSCQASTPADWSCLSNHYVAPLACLRPDDLEWNKEKCKIESDFALHWKINPHHVFTIFGFLKKHCNWENAPEVGYALSLCLDKLLDKELVLLESIETSKQITKVNFCQQPNYRGNFKACPWIAVDAYCFGDYLKVEDRDALSTAQKTQDTTLAHSIMQKILLEEALLEMKMNTSSMQFAFATTEVTEISNWIYDRNLYRRSLDEYTLGRLEVERRIAINLAHSHQGGFSATTTNPETFVDSLIDKLHHERREANKKMIDCRRADIDFIVEQGEKSLKKKSIFLFGC